MSEDVVVVVVVVVEGGTRMDADESMSERIGDDMSVVEFVVIGVEVGGGGRGGIVVMAVEETDDGM